MAGLSFGELARAIVAALLGAWRPCQPLLATAALIALAVAAAVGLLFPAEQWPGLAAVPTTLLTLVVSAGVAGYLVGGQAAFTTLAGVIHEPRSYMFVVRYLLLSLGLALPLVALLPAVVAGGGNPGAGTLLVLIAVLSVTLWLSARLAPFPYSVFRSRPLTLGECFRATDGHGLKILGCVALFGGGILLTAQVVQVAATQLITGLGGGGMAGLGIQALVSIAAAYAVDCVYGTITRQVVPDDTTNVPAPPANSGEH